MQSSLLLSNVAKHIDLQEDEASFFQSLLQEKTIGKKSFLLKEHEVCYHSIFVHSGCLRGYTLDKNGYEHILQFAPEGWWIADMYSMLTGQPGELYIEALEQTEVLLLHIENRNRLLREIPKFERFFRIIVENSLITFRQRLLENLGLPALERYLMFCKRYPTLTGRLPQKQVAAYIGVTPEFLSKMLATQLRKTKSGK